MVGCTQGPDEVVERISNSVFHEMFVSVHVILCYFRMSFMRRPLPSIVMSMYCKLRPAAYLKAHEYVTEKRILGVGSSRCSRCAYEKEFF